MRINPISSKVQCYKTSNAVKRNLREEKQPVNSNSFKGGKGAAIGAAAGLTWGAVVLGICAIGAPYLIPAIAGDVLIGGAGVGAFAGHKMEKDIKNTK